MKKRLLFILLLMCTFSVSFMYAKVLCEKEYKSCGVSYSIKDNNVLISDSLSSFKIEILTDSNYKSKDIVSKTDSIIKKVFETEMKGDSIFWESLKKALETDELETLVLLSINKVLENDGYSKENVMHKEKEEDGVYFHKIDIRNVKEVNKEFD